MRARPFRYDDYVREGLPSLESVFAVVSPYEAVLARGVQEAAVVYPVAELNPGQCAVLGAAAARLGEDALWMTMLDRRSGHAGRGGLGDPDLLSLTENWLIPVGEFAAVDTPAGGLDHAIHSPAGRWAVLISYEHHALVAGPRSFVDDVLDHLPLDEAYTARESVGPWLRNRRELWQFLGSPADHWVPALTLRVYGAERGGRLLRLHGWRPAGRGS